MTRVVVLLSGRGSNFKALLEADLPVKFTAAISNPPDKEVPKEVVVTKEVEKQVVVTPTPGPNPEAVIEGVEPNAEVALWTFWLSPTFDQYIKDTIARFEATYPGVKVKWEDHQATFEDDLRNAFAAGNAPDVINLSVGEGWVSDYATKGLLLSLDDKVPQNVKDLYFPGLWKEQLVDGVNYQFPWYQGIGVELVNTKIYSEAGLKLEDFPKTVDGLPALCKTIKDKTGTLCDIRLTVNDLLAQMVYEGGVKVISDDGKSFTFDSPEAVAWLQMYVDMVKAGTVDKTVLIAEQDRTGLDLFTSGKAAFYQTGPNLIREVRANNPEPRRRTAAAATTRPGHAPSSWPALRSFLGANRRLLSGHIVSFSLFGLVVGAIGGLLAFRTAFRAPAALLLATAAALSTGTGSVSTIREVTDPGWPLAAHITLSALAFGLMATAALLALVLAAQEANVRSRRPARWLAALPPMESMEHAVFTVLTLGFVALSVTLLVGAFFVTDLFGQRLVHKVTLALVAWGIFGVLLLGRYRFGWRGRKARRLVLAGFAVLAMSYLLTKFILEVLLDRHWG